jgi:hypothetical protein
MTTSIVLSELPGMALGLGRVVGKEKSPVPEADEEKFYRQWIAGSARRVNHAHGIRSTTYGK